MKYWVGVTDNGWFEFLNRAGVDEVNFWQPSGKAPFVGLEAAHILPFAESGPNEVSNGMLLRSDFHKLFDLGFVTVTQDFRVEVSQRIREEWFNGRAYYRLHGKELANLPELVADRPDPSFLRWHNDNRYQG